MSQGNILDFGGNIMKNMMNWVTALLAAYRRLPGAVRACKRTSEALAMSGFYCEDTLSLVQKMIDCNARSESYVNAKVLVDDTISKLPVKYADILGMRARTGMSIEEIAFRLGYAKRSAFRWYADGVKKAACALKAAGYDEKWFEERYIKDVLIGDYYLQAQKGADVFCRAERVSDNKLRVSLEDAVAAGILLSEKRAAKIGIGD